MRRSSRPLRARRRTVVFVGGDPAIAALIADSFDAARFTVVAVGDWRGAVDELGRRGADVIVADLDDGVAGAGTLLESLRRSRSSVGIVAIVARAGQGEAIAQALGVRCILAKPVDVESLLTAIASAAALAADAFAGTGRAT